MAYAEGEVTDGTLFGDTLRATPMTYDARYIQELYGVKTGVSVPSYNSTSTNYAYGSATPLTGQKYAWTLWDTGGVDTLDASAVPNEGNVTVPLNVTLDLRGGVDPATNAPYFSLIGKEILSIAYDPRHYNADGSLIAGKSGVVDIEIAKGGLGNDTIIGGYAANTLEGGGGVDLLIEPFTGDAAVNYIYGGAGNDSIYGGANMIGQPGGDFIYGGSGKDTVWMNGGIAVFENDGTGVGEKFIGWTGSSSIRRSDPTSMTDINGITVAVNPEGAFVEVAMGEIGANNTLRIGNLEIKGSFAAPVYHSVYGNLWSLGNGWWIEGNTSQIIVRDANYRAVAEIDEWESGDFGITLSDGQGPSIPLAAIGALPAADHPDFVTPYLMKPREGTAGNDIIQGTNLADSISGGAGNDTLAGGLGNDTLLGGVGNDTLTGGADVDRFVMSTATVAETDTITDFNAAGGEKIDVSAYGASQAITITQTGPDASFVLGGNHTVVMKNVSASQLTMSNFVGVASLKVTVVATSGSESLTGSAGADMIDALGGNDTVSGLGGNDSLYGNSGDDVLIGGAGSDTLNGGSGTDTASYAGSAGNDNHATCTRMAA